MEIVRMNIETNVLCHDERIDLSGIKTTVAATPNILLISLFVSGDSSIHLFL